MTSWGSETLAVVVTVAVLVSFVSRAFASPHVVMTSYGAVQGLARDFEGKTLHTYFGVPFAEPPLGELRFESPKPPLPHKETLVAHNFSNWCIQGEPYRGPYQPQSEDCLYLNVYAPLGEKQAVMVWLHGGSLLHGAGSDTPGEALAMYGSVVIVTVNYRLGAFGFMATGIEGDEPNVGFLDQTMALRWVKENIAAFGGDPEKVTLFGQSAGGWSVNVHMVSPLSEGLFERAISQSGALYGIHMETAAEKSVRTVTLAESLECDTSNVDVMMECLRATNAVRLSRAAYDTKYSGMVPATIGGAFLPEQPRQLWDKREPNADCMMGFNSEEATVVLLMLHDAEEVLQYGIQENDHKFYLLEFLAKFGHHPDIPEAILEQSIRAQYTDAEADPLKRLRAVLDASSDRYFGAPTLGSANRVAESSKDVYLYYFSEVTSSPVRYTPFFPKHESIHSGAGHGTDLPYLFGQFTSASVRGSLLKYNVTGQDEDLAYSMMTAWTTFAKTGKPKFLVKTESGYDALPWPFLDSLNRRYLQIQSPMTSSSIKHRLLPQADSFWNRLVVSLKKEKCDTEVTSIGTTSVIQDATFWRISTSEASAILFLLIAIICLLVIFSFSTLCGYCNTRWRLQQLQNRLAHEVALL